MGKPGISFRVKMILFLVFSMLLAGLALFLAYKAVESYYLADARFADDPLFRLRHIIANGIGDFKFAMLLMIPLTILFFYLFTKPYAAYFKAISRGIHGLAAGDFSSRVVIHSQDEFERIADDINLAGENLQRAVERGDFAESSKNQLVLNLAHDLRTPLTSVLGYLDFILRDEGLSKEQSAHYTRIAFTKSKRLEKLIDELFEVTRMNHGMAPLHRADLDLSELLVQLNEELYPLFENKELTVRPDIAPNVRLFGDGELLARVFENLLTNAARYGADGHYIDIVCFEEGGEAVVQVANYGDSIPPEQLPHLFEMFYTGDQARTHQGGGTGLGLFIVRNIVEQHGGTIEARSDVVRTCFEVRLPLDGGETPPAAEQPALKPRSASRGK
ncbi:Signal transduction histidine kinase [Paenibacillus sp. UNC496MF]|uniref:sensor histidine kinase n=1 Tax=Paenibacillus sp. UNC496MF TaxID=1502753 RepID=UPI0008F34724|nr:HAMP domain-containing sensor histidine kinase [Paenibacillus sp. UNC496MF]SFJ22370.1 Signal transduction histidine kinase [Paenibacillus sp. UNC496MF]